MWDDTVYQYLGREAEWAAQCALDAVESDTGTPYTEADAGDLVRSVWEFVSEICSEAGVAIPDEATVIHLVTQRIIERKEEEK